MNLYSVKVGMTVQLNQAFAEECGSSSLSEVQDYFLLDKCNDFLRSVNKWTVVEQLSGGTFDNGEAWSYFKVEPVLEGTELTLQDFLDNGDDEDPIEAILFDNVSFDVIE